MKAHAANDAAVLDACVFSPEATGCEIFSLLFDLYEKLTKDDDSGKVKKS